MASRQDHICQECKDQQHRAQAAEAIALSQAAGLVTLRGTERQIVWAEQIRDRLIPLIDASREKFLARCQRREAKGKEIPDKEKTLTRIEKTINWLKFHMNRADLWIDIRDAQDGTAVLDWFYRHFHKEIEAPQVPTAQVSADRVRIAVQGDDVLLIHAKDEKFRQLVKAAGCTWDSGRFCWIYHCTQFTGDPEDRGAELGAALIAAGYDVVFDLPAMQDKALAGSWTPKPGLFVRRLADGPFAGWLSIDLPNAPGPGAEEQRERLYTQARALEGSEYYKGSVVLPPARRQAVLEFAQQNGYALSKGAREIMNQEEDV